jgi:hypothetical protein
MVYLLLFSNVPTPANSTALLQRSICPTPSSNDKMAPTLRHDSASPPSTPGFAQNDGNNRKKKRTSTPIRDRVERRTRQQGPLSQYEQAKVRIKWREADDVARGLSKSLQAKLRAMLPDLMKEGAHVFDMKSGANYRTHS